MVLEAIFGRTLELNDVITELRLYGLDPGKILPSLAGVQPEGFMPQKCWTSWPMEPGWYWVDRFKLDTKQCHSPEGEPTTYIKVSGRVNRICKAGRKQGSMWAPSGKLSERFSFEGETIIP